MSMHATKCLWAAALATLTGCGVQEGDYVVYRVGIEQVVVSPRCYTDDDPQPLDEALSSSTLLAPATWVIYYGADDQVILDAAGFAVGGEEVGGGFEFTGHTVDVDYDGVDNLEAKVTVTTTTTINIEESGNGIMGEVLAVSVTTCDFLTATPSSGLCEVIDDCERTAGFAGVELPDADLDTTVNRSNPL